MKKAKQYLKGKKKIVTRLYDEERDTWRACSAYKKEDVKKALKIAFQEGVDVGLKHALETLPKQIHSYKKNHNPYQ